MPFHLLATSLLTPSALAWGVLAALIVGLSKTALPGAGMLVPPILATVVAGRLIAGTMLPMLLVADMFALWWYGRHHARLEVVKPLIPGVAAGFVLGTLFYVIVAAGGRALDITLGGIILVLVALQGWRTLRAAPPLQPTTGLAHTVGTAGGFTTFVSNAAGPVMSTYMMAVGLPKEQLMGTSAWFFFAVNAAKVPVYLAIGKFSEGGHFFTGESLRYDVALVPVIVAGVYLGKLLFPRISQKLFNAVVLALAALAAVKLVLGL